MIVQIVIVCLLPAVLLAQTTGIVIADVLRPKSISSEEFNQRISDFWTADKLKQAKPLDIALSKLTSKSVSETSKVLSGPESTVPGSAPVNSGLTSKIIATNGRQISTTGRVFWQVGTDYYSCSAAVVTSNSSDLISTAGHCVYDTTTKTWYNNNNWVFLPGYSNGNATYGKWSMRRVIVLQAWTSSSDFNYDVAFVALSTLNGQHIQSKVGSQGLGFNYPRSAYIYSFGYPININSGLTLQKCEGYTSKSQWTQNGYVGQGLSCNMGGGCSGGPWLQNVVDTTGIGYVTSVNSFSISNVLNVINGPYFDSNTKYLYQSATSM